MKNRRWSDDNRHFWPFTLSKESRKDGHWAVMLDSGGAEGHSGGCHIRFSGFGWTLICELPPILRPCRERVTAHWDAATVERMGRDWYENSYAREFGFSLSEGNLHVHYGAQTHCWPGCKSKVFFLPWRHWRFIRNTLYTPEGVSFYTDYEGKRDREAWWAFKDACPKVQFDFEDYDGKPITATTHIEEREWRFGTSWCRWLSLFRKPRVSRDLMLEFSEEVGPEKGSWKGGTVGTSIEMLAGETPEAAFIRYCSMEHRSRGGRYRVRYLGRTTETVPDGAA